MLHELIYTSVESRPMTETGLTSMLTEARDKNLRLDVTGLLFYHNREFVQLLEGEKDVIFELLKRIVVDSRHLDVIVFWDAPIEARSFQDWSMGFASNNEALQLESHGYTKFLENGLSALNLTENGSEGRDLMLALRDLML